jgi:hypothetical protein
MRSRPVWIGPYAAVSDTAFSFVWCWGNQQARALDFGPWASRSRTEWALLAGAGRWDCRQSASLSFCPASTESRFPNLFLPPRRRTFPPHGVRAEHLGQAPPAPSRGTRSVPVHQGSSVFSIRSNEFAEPGTSSLRIVVLFWLGPDLWALWLGCLIAIHFRFSEPSCFMWAWAHPCLSWTDHVFPLLQILALPALAGWFWPIYLDWLVHPSLSLLVEALRTDRFILSHYFDIGQFSSITMWKHVNRFFHVGLDITGPLEWIGNLHG